MKKHFIRNRKVRYGSITAILTVLIVTVTVLFNTVFGTLATRYQWYTQMNAALNYDVTEDCYTLLGSALSTMKADGTQPIEIVFCDVEKNIGEDAMLSFLYATADSLAQRYPQSIRVVCHDIWTNPNAVRRFTETLDPLTGETVETKLKSSSVIISYEDYHRVYGLEEFFVFKDGNLSNVWAYNGEKKLAAGILHALDSSNPIVCLTNNHGEVFYDYELLYLLDDAGYRVNFINLHTDPIPDNCRLLITYNPNTDLTLSDGVSVTSETQILDSFLSKDGNGYLVFMNKTTPYLENFEAYLEGWGVDFAYYQAGERSYRHMVQDTAQSLTSDGYTIYGEPVTGAASAPLMEGIDRKIVFKNATAIKNANGFVNNADGSYTNADGTRTMYSLYEGAESALCWANGIPVASGEGAIMMSVTEQKLGDVTSYVGVVASTDFCEETFLQSAVYGNGDVLHRTLKNMGRGMTPEGLTIKPFSSQEISTVTTRQMLVWTIALAATPAVVIASAGILVLVKRRNA